MKKLLSTSFLILSLLVLSQTTTFAQAQQYKPIKVGAGIFYGDEPEAAGVQVNGNFRVSRQVVLAPDVTIYFPNGDDSGYDSYWAINLNGHYIFNEATAYQFYGIGGLNITNANYSFIDDNDTKLGINVGVGAEYHLQSFSLFGEIKYIISDLDQVVLGVGARIPIK